MTFAPRQPWPESRAQRPPPLAMPDQTLRAAFHDPGAPGLRSSRATVILRALVLSAPVAATVALGVLSFRWFTQDGRLTLAEAALIAVSGFAFFWVILSVATAMLGLFWRPKPQTKSLHGLRVAILLPMYGEAAGDVIGNAVRLLSGLTGTERHHFALHILSDTRTPAAAAQEEAAVAVARRHHVGLTITYRRRARNTDYKSGNIRDWVQTAGHAHDAMLILDADSIMGPQTVLLLADAMAQEPGLGLIQTVPRVLPGTTLWQGLQSFASEVYGVNMGRGFAMWSGAESNFLGHNAMVRIRAFAASAGLPHLPGTAPRGGVILSHDFVEAALLRRAGWGVRMMPEASDSFEDTPENLTGYLRRDRRWCQGNLQHLRLLLAPGLHPVSRFHLFQGAMSYLASVWWLALLILWALPDGPAASPFLPTLPLLTQAALAGSVAMMLLAPKLLGLISYLRQTGVSRAKASRFAGLVLAEAVVSALLAPALMLHQARAVAGWVWGRDGGWRPHVAGGSDWRGLVRFHALESGLGAVLLALVLAGHLSLWILPVATSLCLTVPLAALVQMPRSAFHIGFIRQRIA